MPGALFPTDTEESKDLLQKTLSVSIHKNWLLKTGRNKIESFLFSHLSEVLDLMTYVQINQFNFDNCDWYQFTESINQ